MSKHLAPRPGSTPALGAPTFTSLYISLFTNIPFLILLSTSTFTSHPKSAVSERHKPLPTNMSEPAPGMAHSLTGEHKAHEAELIDTPQPRVQHPATTTSSCDTDHHPVITHPAAFSFPTLSPDGSVDDISTLSPRRRQPAPPAALSSLAARMADRGSMVDSTSSLADSTYDMVDDVSEISSDDHDTASLLSVENEISNEGLIVTNDNDDDDDDSVVDVEEMPHETREPISHPQDLSHAEAACDSFLSDDLDTPRQSTVDRSLQLSPLPPRPDLANAGSSSPTDTIGADKHLRMLFISEGSVPEKEMETICSKITTCLDGSGSSCQVVRLPTTPSGTNPSSETIFRNGKVQLSVQQCVGGDLQGTDPLGFRLQEVAGQHTSVDDVEQVVKATPNIPDFALIYVWEQFGWLKPAWACTARERMRTLGVPVMWACKENSVLVSLTARYLGHVAIDDLLLEDSTPLIDLPSVDDHQLSRFLRTLLQRDQPAEEIQPTEKIQPPSLVAPPKEPKISQRSYRWLNSFAWMFAVSAALTLILQIIAAIMTPITSIAETAIRREALEIALNKVINTTDACRAIDTHHLLPKPSATSTGVFGQPLYSTLTTVPFAHASPNHMIFSLPRERNYFSYPSIESVRAYKSDRELAFNCTKLISGVYDVTIDPEHAYGLVTVDLITANPVYNVTHQHNFGNKMLRKQTYQRVGTDLAKSMNKELSVMTKAARSLGEMLGLELSAGAAATKNATTQVALYVARDFMVLANSATSVMSKVGKGYNDTAAAAGIITTKDLMTIMQKDVVKFTKRTVRTPLQLSMQHARGLRDKVAGHSKHVANNLRCLPWKDFTACKNAQEKSLSVLQAPGSLSTIASGRDSNSPTTKKTTDEDRRACKSTLEMMENMRRRVAKSSLGVPESELVRKIHEHLTKQCGRSSA